ncbi:SH3 domain-binding glutamic acid-rich-like protein 3 [Anoplopoma fimbria]|uniref:SH3 domain-binding glutamic acid-rich-like protein 3 n=1 Tax=Anoplopoma fimbria TaxID=229290 RepID=UPI0023EDB01F|nr:SH3 domain-binding glutamic acid-rich-like protein 3 [Anoplopoma fimbria]
MSKPALLVCCCFKPAPHTCIEDTGTLSPCICLNLSLEVVLIADMSIKVFYTSVSGSIKIKKHQQKIFDVLDSKKINYEAVDIAQDPEHKAAMRELAKDDSALPPQICNGEHYCGDYTAFEIAVEDETLDGFLKR